MKKLKRNSKLDRPWHKFYENVPKSLNYPDKSMFGLLEETVKKYPNAIAYEFYGISVTYKRFYEKIKECAKALKAQGIKANDKVSICMPNTPQAIVFFYAINMIGAISSMIHPLSGEKEIEYYVNTSKSNLLLTIDLVYNKMSNIFEATCLKRIIVASIAAELSFVKSFLVKLALMRKTPSIDKSAQVITWKEFLTLGSSYDKDFSIKSSSSDIASILYSGGTTGAPKGILLSNMNFNALALQTKSMVEQAGVGVSILSILPIFHGFGLGVSIHTPLCAGMKCILIPDFKASKFGDLIKKYKPNIICGVPTLYESLIKSNLGRYDLANLTCVVSGGDQLTSLLKKKLEIFLYEHGSDAPVRIGYGLTEGTAASCLCPSFANKDNSLGIPLPDMDYKIVKTGTHMEVPPNNDGEICISGPTVMIGYLDNIKETAQALRLHEDGKLWLHTGDIGCMDNDGFIFFKQRLKRMIITSGYNVYPSYVEEVINSFPGVITSTVVGISHPYKMQVPKAYIVISSGLEKTKEYERRLKEHCKKNLPSYSVPYQFEFRDDLPKTFLGKVAYKELEENK